jgi:biopolymer transport protein ExbD
MAKKQRAVQDAEVPISAMIDIVFLLIIFFVVTAAIDKEMEDEEIKLANSPHGKPVTKKDPRAVTINVRKDGTYNINGQVMNKAQVSNVLKNAASEWGIDIPIIIRGDASAPHGYIKEVMEAVTNTQLYKVKFNAIIQNQQQ